MRYYNTFIEIDQADKNVGIVDCILCAKAKSYNKLLFTFDERLKKLSEKVIPILFPEAFSEYCIAGERLRREVKL